MSAKQPIVISSYAPLDKAQEAFLNGEVVAYPTETYYGLAVDPFNETAVRKLYELKGRDFGNPLTVIVSDKSKVFDLVEYVPALGRKLMERFWPGALTVVFKASKTVPDILIANKGTIGIRVSVNPVATEFARGVRSAITATSANPTGEEPPTTAEQVINYFGDKIAVVIDGGEVSGGKGSTVVDVSKIDVLKDSEAVNGASTEGFVEIVREGIISTDEILKVY